jgi:hypothetical protein
MIWPKLGHVPSPNTDLPEQIKKEYNEAGAIFELSPRGACALLRLVVQRLCVHLGGSGKNLNDDIAGLVRNGLPVRIQQSMDLLRVIGNNAVHPGQINLSDDRSTAQKLFILVNVIADTMITHPKHISALYESLPEEQRAQIERRDRG